MYRRPLYAAGLVLVLLAPALGRAEDSKRSRPTLFSPAQRTEDRTGLYYPEVFRTKDRTGPTDLDLLRLAPSRSGRSAAGKNPLRYGIHVRGGGGLRIRDSLDILRISGRTAEGERVLGRCWWLEDTNLSYRLSVLDCRPYEFWTTFHGQNTWLSLTVSLGASECRLTERIGEPSQFRRPGDGPEHHEAHSGWGFRVGGRLEFAHGNPLVPVGVIAGVANFVSLSWLLLGALTGFGPSPNPNYSGLGHAEALLWPFKLMERSNGDWRLGVDQAHMVFGFLGELDLFLMPFHRQVLFDRTVSGRGRFWEWRVAMFTGVKLLQAALLKVGGELVGGEFEVRARSRDGADESWRLLTRSWAPGFFAELTVLRVLGLGLDLRASTAGGGTYSVSTGFAF